MKKKEIEKKLLNMQDQIEMMQICLPYLIKKECNSNSLKQVNDSYDDYKDRCDVNKAMDDFLKIHPLKTHPFTRQRWRDSDAKSFAIFFAERVKGGKL